MTAIEKTFIHEGESFTVKSENKEHGLVTSYNCLSHVDKKLWHFTVEEIRKALESK